MHFHLKIVEEEAISLVLEVKVEVLREVDIIVVQQILVVRIKTKISVTQVAKSLISHIFSVIVVRSLGIMPMNAKRNSMTSKSKVRTSQLIHLRPLHALRWLSQLIQILPLSAISSKKAQVTWYLDSRCTNHMMGNIELFSSLDESIQTGHSW